MIDCSCRLGHRCDNHKQCQDDGHEHEWIDVDEKFRLEYRNGRNGPEDVRAVRIVMLGCKHCDRHGSRKERVA